MAAGMTLRENDVPEFERAFAAEVARWIDDDTLAGHLHTDGALLPGEFDARLPPSRCARAGPGVQASRNLRSTGEFGVIESRIVGRPPPEAAAARRLRRKPWMRSHSGTATMRGRRPSVAQDRRRTRLPRRAWTNMAGSRRLQLITEWIAVAGSAPRGTMHGRAC